MLTKETVGVDAAVGKYYIPDAARPLSIVRTGNTLVANAARLRWEPTVEDRFRATSKGS